MPIPQHVQLRLKRERDFQARVLATLEKPKQGRLLAAVNSRLFSVAVLGLTATIVGGYFTHFQQCVRDADQIGEKYARILKEITYRRTLIGDAIAKASSVSEIRIGLSSLRGMFPEFSGRMTIDLMAEYTSLWRRIEFPEAYAQVLFPRNIQTFIQDGTYRRFSIIDSAAQLPLSAQESDLSEIKQFSQRWFSEVRAGLKNLDRTISGVSA